MAKSAVCQTAKKPKTGNSQHEAAGEFISVGRRLGADDSKEHFEKKLGKIAKAKPQK
jgi:hypothetical protein